MSVEDVDRADSVARASVPDFVVGGLVRHRVGHPTGRSWVATVEAVTRPCGHCAGSRACLVLGQGGRPRDVRWCARDWETIGVQGTLF